MDLPEKYPIKVLHPFIFKNMHDYEAFKKNPLNILDLEVFMKHPIYDQYSASKSGFVYDIKNCVLVETFTYKNFHIGKNNCHEKNCIEYKYQLVYINIDYYSIIDITYPLHRFIWECFNGIVPIGSSVDHIDGVSYSNVLDNLHLVPYEIVNFDCNCFEYKKS